MRRRYLIDTFSTYLAAHDAKEALIVENPDKEYQVRRSGNSFRLVERLSSQEAVAIKRMRK